MKLKLFISLAAFSIFQIVVTSCASSTGSRYSKNEIDKTSDSLNLSNSNFSDADLKENFDITPYKTNIVIPEKTKSVSNSKSEVWFDYGSSSADQKKKVLAGTTDGFRVLVLSTDNIEEANQIKADVNDKVDRNEVYIDFEPPFYKVKVGDFSDQKSADNLRFMLNQLGYKEAKVIKDKINVFK